jgi:hypothetical protein
MSKAGLLVQASRDTIKLNTLEGESKQGLLGNNPDVEEFLLHFTFFTRHLEKTGVEGKLKKATELAESIMTSLKKLLHAPVKEKDEAKVKRLESVKGTKEDLATTWANVATRDRGQKRVPLMTYSKLLADDTEAHWDQILSDMHTKDPWTDLIGVKHKGVRPWTQESPKVCIEFHKLTVFTVDAAERLKYYLMLCHVKKPVRYTIHKHVACMELLNKYVELIPTIKNSPKAVASTEFGNIPFSKATLASVILASLPSAWRNQYSLTHITIPESARAIIDSLESIKTLFVEKGHEKARANKAKATEAYKAISNRVPSRKRTQEGSLKKGAPKKGRSAKYCIMCKAAGWSFNTHDTAECCRFEKDDTTKASLVKPFDSAKKPWKKPGSGEASQITYLTKKMAKLKKKLNSFTTRGPYAPADKSSFMIA